MLNKLKKSKNEGFTIIEVMIVLAIAGLILLIVFLAVPALQRSSRNTQRKTDVGRIGSAATTIVSNANGVFPATPALFRAAIVQEVGTTSYYDFTIAANLVARVQAPGAAAAGPVVSKDVVDVEGNAKCAAGAATTAYSLRNIAVMYAVESGAGVTSVCIDQ